MKLEIHRATHVERTIRVRQLESLFDVPATEKLEVNINGELPIEERPWSVGLIVGPSGSGKSLTLRQVFGESPEADWTHGSCIDDFPQTVPMADIVEACRSVGFNTIPSWLRPYSVLSNGEQFRVRLARHLVSDCARGGGLVSIDEFSSVVDRQVAKIASYAIQKVARRNRFRFVAASCHYDIIEWLDPDWVFEPATGLFSWRVLRQKRPGIDCRINRVHYACWPIFAPFHYMSQELSHAAQCFGLFVEDQIVSFTGVLHFPHPRVRDIVRVSRTVTLPDWQGLGLNMALVDRVASAYTALGKRFRHYPNHPALVRTLMKSVNWIQIKESGDFSPRQGDTSGLKGKAFGGKQCAVFEYCGAPMNDYPSAFKLVNGI